MGKTVAMIDKMNQTLLWHKRVLDDPQCNAFNMDDAFWASDKKRHKHGWRQQSSGDQGAETVRWSQWLFKAGTHYLLLDTEGSGDFNLDMVGPKGSVYLGGGDSTKA